MVSVGDEICGLYEWFAMNYLSQGGALIFLMWGADAEKNPREGVGPVTALAHEGRFEGAMPSLYKPIALWVVGCHMKSIGPVHIA